MSESLPRPEHCGWCVQYGKRQFMFGREADGHVETWKALGLEVQKVWLLPEMMKSTNTTKVISRLLKRIIELSPGDPVVVSIIKKYSDKKD